MTPRTLVVFSLEDWDGTWRRNQYLVDGMLRRDPDLRVVFVEPAADVPHALLTRRRLLVGRGARLVEGYADRLIRLQPTKWLPRIAGPLADRGLRAQVARALHRYGVGDRVLWVNDPGWASVVERWGLPALYDMTDDWLAADRPSRERRRLAANEGSLLERCSAVVVCSPGLEASRRRVRPDLVLIPNAVDVRRYRRTVARPAGLPAGPVALYAGTLHEDRLDVALTAETSRAMAAIGGAVVLVGPDALSRPSRELLAHEPGVVLLGARPYLEMPGYLRHADVLIVPHVVTAFTDSLDPIKLYEYRAVGRPVVSTPVAGFRDIADRNVVASEREEFAAAVARAARPRRADVLDPDVPDWSDRVRMMTEVVARIASHHG